MQYQHFEEQCIPAVGDTLLAAERGRHFADRRGRWRRRWAYQLAHNAVFAVGDGTMQRCAAFRDDLEPIAEVLDQRVERLDREGKLKPRIRRLWAVQGFRLLMARTIGLAGCGDLDLVLVDAILQGPIAAPAPTKPPNTAVLIWCQHYNIPYPRSMLREALAIGSVADRVKIVQCAEIARMLLAD